MFESVAVTAHKRASLMDFLVEREFIVEKISDAVLSVHRQGELPVYISMDGNTLFFEVDLGNVADFANERLYFKILDLNTEILPVSAGIDTTNSEDPRLVLVESREADNLDDNEILSVLDAMELAVDKMEVLLKEYVK
jgi:uncharacterized protein YjfI (DUF2170 family)